MNKNVWIFGLAGAVALAVDNCPGLPAPLYPILKAIAAVCAVLAGYHYPAPPDAQHPVPVQLAGTCLVLAVLACGCQMSRFSLDVASPAFGSVGLSVGGGMIGHPTVQTNVTRPNTGSRRPAVVTNGVAVVASP